MWQCTLVSLLTDPAALWPVRVQMHVGFTVTANGGPVLVYVNGATVGSTSATFAPASLPAVSTPIVLGAEHLGRTGTVQTDLDGYIDDVAFWKVGVALLTLPSASVIHCCCGVPQIAITATDMSNLASTVNLPWQISSGNILGYYALDEGLCVLSSLNSGPGISLCVSLL